MKWETINRCGKICEAYKKLDLNQGKIITRKFLYETLREFAKVSTKIFDTTGDRVFEYKEKQLSSIFLPAFYNLSYGVIQEVPTRRKGMGKNSSHGWLDYWVQKDEKWIYLIEVKQAWQFLNGNFRKDSMDKLLKSIKQLKDIRKIEIRNLSDSETTYRISLIILPIWRNVPREENIQVEDEYPTKIPELEGTTKKMLEMIEKRISWLGLWATPDRMQEAFDVKYSKSLQTFPGVCMIASLVE